MPTAAERRILEYLIDTGFIDDRLVALAKQVLAGESLSHGEQAAYRHGIVERWFRLDCEQCDTAVAIEDIPVAIELGDALCPRCRRPGGDADLLTAPMHATLDSFFVTFARCAQKFWTAVAALPP